LPTLRLASPDSVKNFWPDFENVRYGMDKPLSSKATCADSLSWPVHNGLGWNMGKDRCDVSNFTNVYLGVPLNGASHHTLRFEVDHADPAPLRVYANGRVYKTRTDGDAYVVDLDVDGSKFLSPIVEITIEWTGMAEGAPKLRLKSVELV
jgi:hypothetical protein